MLSLAQPSNLGTEMDGVNAKKNLNSGSIGQAAEIKKHPASERVWQLPCGRPWGKREPRTQVVPTPRKVGAR